MSNELVSKEVSSGALTEFSFDDIVSSGDFLPRLQLFGSKSDACAEGKIDIGRYGIVKDDVITDVGKEVDVAILSWRPKALQTGGDYPITDFDPNSELFKKIVGLASVKDSGCQYGPEFLLWIPSQSTFCTFHMGSKTARREARKVEPLIRKAATLKCKLIEKYGYKWHGPVVIPCSAPLNMPPIADIELQCQQFQNPPKADVEVVEEKDDGRER